MYWKLFTKFWGFILIVLTFIRLTNFLSTIELYMFHIYRFFFALIPCQIIIKPFKIKVIYKTDKTDQLYSFLLYLLYHINILIFPIENKFIADFSNFQKIFLLFYEVFWKKLENTTKEHQKFDNMLTNINCDFKKILCFI
jgi:hypothetical protein